MLYSKDKKEFYNGKIDFNVYASINYNGKDYITFLNSEFIKDCGGGFIIYKNNHYIDKFCLFELLENARDYFENTCHKYDYEIKNIF